MGALEFIDTTTMIILRSIKLLAEDRKERTRAIRIASPRGLGSVGSESKSPTISKEKKKIDKNDTGVLMERMTTYLVFKVLRAILPSPWDHMAL